MQLNAQAFPLRAEAAGKDLSWDQDFRIQISGLGHFRIRYDIAHRNIVMVQACIYMPKPLRNPGKRPGGLFEDTALLILLQRHLYTTCASFVGDDKRLERLSKQNLWMAIQSARIMSGVPPR